jgi:dimethylargininase
MKNYLRNLYSCAMFISISSSLYGQVTSPTDFSFYQCALVRNLSDSFEESLKLNPPTVPIDLNLAKQQHENYTVLLEKLVPKVIRLDADPNHPDCNFIEDTAIIVNDIAVISRMGAPERRGEEIPVAHVIEELGIKNIIYLQSPGTMDGGDILYTGKHLFVGLSKRTNEYALKQLKEIFQDKTEVIGIPVTEGLHLKSVISFFDPETLIVAATPAGMKIQSNIELSTNSDYMFVSVPESIASNVLRIGSSLIVQEGFSASETILQDLCNLKFVTLIKINMSELIKADGALTCGSLLFNPNDK